jgi:hypothetical protein
MTRSKWATVALSLWLGFVVLAVAVGSCSIDKKSDSFQSCERQADCSNGESCIDGVCLPPDLPGDDGGIDVPPPDGNSCPAQCTSCMTVGGNRVCVVDCTVSAPTCNAMIRCPPGFDCDIRCSREGSCQKGIQCAGDQSCDITCSGRQACRDISCGDGPCQISCSGEQSCREIACNDSCQCDVECGQTSLCAEVTCFEPQCVSSNLKGCTSERPGCNADCP